MSNTITTPKQLAEQLGVDQKWVRRHLRAKFGTHHKRWELSSEQVEAIKKRAKDRKVNKPNDSEPNDSEPNDSELNDSKPNDSEPNDSK